MIGSTNLSGGGGVGSDELTATSANVLENTTYVGADTDDELAEGTMQHLTNRATITHTAENVTKVIEGDAAFTSTNSNGTARAEIRYNGTEGFITPNTLFAVPQGDMATAGGLTAEKLLEGQSAFGIAGAATSDATATANQISSGKIAYVKGSKITGTLAERGQSQYGNFGQGNGYVAINALPEGIYRSNGAAWAPEARIATSTLASGIGLNASVIKKGVSILGITGSFEGYVSNPLYLFKNGSYGGGQSGISIMSKSYSNYSVSFGSSIQGSNLYKGQIIMRFNNIQNLSGWNYLKIYGNVEAWAEIGGGVSTENNKTYMTSLNTYAEWGASSGISGNGTCVCNISSFSGNYWIYILVGHVSGNHASSASISQVYLSTN